MQYLVTASILVTLFKCTDLQIDTALLQNAVEKFNLQQRKNYLTEIINFSIIYLTLVQFQ